MYKSGRCFFNKLPNIIIGMGTALVSWVIGGHAHAAQALEQACLTWQPDDTYIDDNGDSGCNDSVDQQFGSFYYIDSNGNRVRYTHCEGGCDEGYLQSTQIVEVPGCNKVVEYVQCLEQLLPPSNNYCEQDYYYNNGFCFHCPGAVVDFVNENGTPLDSASGQCGYGTEAGFGTPISDCKIYASGCEYCDDSGCFELRNDCWYNFS